VPWVGVVAGIAAWVGGFRCERMFGRGGRPGGGVCVWHAAFSPSGKLGFSRPSFRA